jgi:peroxiredoxin
MFAGLAVASWTLVAGAAPVPPHLGAPGQDEYRDFLEAADHRAFAIAPGGAWGWSSGKASVAAAEDEALAVCQGQTEQRCVLFAVDERTVFDAANWPKLWRPYADKRQAERATIGRQRGQRLFDIAYTDAKGRKTRLSALRGKVVIVHFWGAWCGPCRREMPDLQKTWQTLSGRSDFALVMLQARERFEVSRKWTEQQGISLPLADSGSGGDDDASFRLAEGGKIRDREIASRFPTTYVVDRTGIVLFSHVGPISDWSQYTQFLTDAADQSRH